ncbi:MAG: hypothetical protein EB059_03970 [Alphaproteobacteria bacterium]|nr:hypothetical protein [Alphaproteobacteria bacterium]
MLVMLPRILSAQESPVPGQPEPGQPEQNEWQNLQDFDETVYFAVAGPPMQEDVVRARAETDLYEEMVANVDDLEEEEDNDYEFVVESIFGPDDLPASLRVEDDDMIARWESNAAASQTSSIYIDAVRPTYFPGFQIKPRVLDETKKDNQDARSLFADIEKPPEKPEVKKPDEAEQAATDPAKREAKREFGAKQSNPARAGKINAPPKRPLSPDEETLGELKQAVKELGLEKQLNLGKGVDSHQVLEHQGDRAAPVVTPAAKQARPVKKKKRKAVKKRRPAVIAPAPEQGAENPSDTSSEHPPENPPE